MQKPKNPYKGMYTISHFIKGPEHIWQECSEAYDKYIEEIIGEFEEFRSHLEYVDRGIEDAIIRLKTDKE